MPKQEKLLLEPEPKKAPKFTYKTSKWHDLPNYECNHCPFSTLSKEEILDHMERVHVKPVTSPPKIVGALKLDRFGNVVLPEKEV